MPLCLPFKLIEITVRSAQDLPPLSKLLQTYAVVSIQPDHKFTTRVDRQGHTSPTWNEKFVFRVDEKFLNTDTSVVTIEIYSISWLRDIPIGTVRVLVNELIPPSSWFKKNSNTRFVSLQISRPSGHLQGILNIGVNLIDSATRSMPLCSEQSCSSTMESRDSTNQKMDKIFNHFRKKDEEKNKNKRLINHYNNKDDKKDVKTQLHRSQSDITVSKSDSLDDLSINGSECWDSKVTNGSIYSYMRPLPSDLAVALRKGLYSTASDEIGSSIFEGWTVAGDNDEIWKSKVVRWTDEFTPTTTTDRDFSRRHADQGGDKGGGLFSCFSIACGYECNIFCGTPSGKNKNKNKNKNKKKRFGNKSYVGVSHADEKSPRFYINS